MDLNTPLLHFSNTDAWTLKDACEGVQIIGGTGSGKTSGSGKAIAKSYLENGFGGLVLTVKPDEAEQWAAWADETGRKNHLLFVRPGLNRVFNLLDYELNRPYGGETENIVDLFSRIIEITSQSDLADGENAYFYLAAQQLLRNAIDLCKLAANRVSIPMVYEVIATAPTSPKEVDNKEWQQSSLCFKYLSLANEAYRHKPFNYDLDMCMRYFLSEYPRFGDRLRASITTIFTACADPFMRGFLRNFFSSDVKEGFQHVDPILALKGAIIVFDCPIKRYGLVGRVAQSLYKMMFQQAMERRNLHEDGGRPVFLWADENQNFINGFDVEFQQTARSSRVLTVYLTQNISNYHVSLGQGDHGKAQATSILGNLSTKIFHANSDFATNEWASNVFGADWQFYGSVNSGASDNASDTGFSSGSSSGTSFSEQRRNILEPREFTLLAKGGEENDFIVEAIVHQAGRIWNSTGENYIRVQFSQKD